MLTLVLLLDSDLVLLQDELCEILIKRRRLFQEHTTLNSTETAHTFYQMGMENEGLATVLTEVLNDQSFWVPMMRGSVNTAFGLAMKVYLDDEWADQSER